jgi:hypothetical protein
MEKSKTKLLIPIIGGILLIAVGVLLLLDTLGVFQFAWVMLIGPLIGLGGLVFVMVFILFKKEWWAVIPGLVLIAVGLSIFMDQRVQDFSGRWGGLIFMSILGLAFLLVFITHPGNWWAIIPAGVLITLGGISLLDGSDWLQGGLLFLGLALTFGLVYILPKPAGRLKWALYPAVILLVISIAVFLGVNNLINYVWPAALLVAGGYIVYRALRRPK